MQKLVNLIKDGSEASGFNCGIWNSAMIGEVIWLKFGVTYNLNYLSSLLKKLVFSYKKARFVSDRQEEEKYEAAKRVAGSHLARHYQKSKSRKQRRFIWR